MRGLSLFYALALTDIFSNDRKNESEEIYDKYFKSEKKYPFKVKKIFCPMGCNIYLFADSQPVNDISCADSYVIASNNKNALRKQKKPFDKVKFNTLLYKDGVKYSVVEVELPVNLAVKVEFQRSPAFFNTKVWAKGLYASGILEQDSDFIEATIVDSDDKLQISNKIYLMPKLKNF